MGRTTFYLLSSSLLVSACGARSSVEETADDAADSSRFGGAAGVSFTPPSTGGRSPADEPAPLGGRSDSGGEAQAGAEAGKGGAQVKPVVPSAISAGTDSTCGLHGDGTVWCWGANDKGQLGNATTTPTAVPAQVIGIGSAVAIAAGGTWNAGGMGAARSSFNCAVLRDGSVQCWGEVPGYDSNGAQQSGGFAGTSVPILVPGIHHAIAVAAGNWHVCVLLSSGSLQCWGNNRWGQLGNGGLTGGSDPVTVLGIENATAVVGLGSNFSCALLAGGSVKCWGGYLADPNRGTAQGSTTPLEVPIAGPASSIAAGYDRACAVVADRSVQCWTGPNSVPVAVPGVGSATAVTVGVRHACALLSDGTIQCWGENDHGELGTNQPSRPVSNIHDAVAISAGYSYSCAVLKSGTTWCWGSDTTGQLGDGGELGMYNVIPVQVVGF